MKVYISGPITNNPNYKEQFSDAEQKLKRAGLEPVNPITDVFKTWAEYMKDDIKLLCDCDAICLLDGWEKSEGAKLEFEISKALHLIRIILGNL